MRLALTFNEKRTAGEEHAEFDTRDTIDALVALLAALGHDVTVVEVTRPLDEVVAELRALAPDLVFNLAEGERGRFRESLYPAVFEHLGLRHTGSSAGVLALCLDKALTKRIVSAAGVATPHARLVRSLAELPPIDGPVIVKPNFEGSSKGITQASVVATRRALETTTRALLARYPAGVLVEQYVDGIDVSIGWVDGLGLLPPIRYHYAAAGPHHIYDLALKQGPPESITVVIDALAPPIGASLARAAATAFGALGVAGYGRADFRVTPDGDIQFIEMNPLPSLAPRERDLYAAAAHAGTPPRELIARIVAAAA